MKREIKFRLWSNSLKIMFSPNSEIGHLWSIKEAPNGNIKVDDGDVLMQFTGIHDCDGNEIYEGDILQGGVYSRYDVEWDFYQNGWNIGANAQYFKIIGNIYETKN
jgi:hypothetical protein